MTAAGAAVCDPLRLLDRGWSLVPIPRGGKRCLLPGWPRFGTEQPTEDDLAEWARRWPGHGWGIPLGPTLLAIDIDTDDPAEQEIVERLRRTELPFTPLLREGRPGRVVALYRLAEPYEGPQKIAGGKIELLTGSKLVVAFAIHPDIQRAYDWLLDNPHDVDPDEAPVVEPARIAAFAMRVEQALGRPVRADGHAGTGSGEWHVDPATGLVVDGREEYLRALAWQESRDSDDERLVAARIWQRFAATADLSRRHGNKPWSERNALAKAKAAIRKRRRQAEAEARKAASRAAPLPPVRELELPDAEALLRREVADFIRTKVETKRDPKAPRPALGIQATPGLGKSTTVLRELAPLLQDGSKTVWYLVPTLKLADELAPKAQALGIPVRVIRGRGDPAKPDEALCHPDKLPLVNKLARAGHPVQERMCYHKDKQTGVERRCPFHDSCRYPQQFQGDLASGLVIVAHEWLRLPQERLPKPDLVVIDERFFPSLIRGEASLPLSRLDAARVPNRKVTRRAGRRCFNLRHALDVSEDETADQQERMKILRRALESGAPIRQLGLTADELTKMAKVEGAFVEAPPAITPDMALAEQRRRVEALVEQESWKITRLCKLLAEDFDRPGGSQRVEVQLGRPWHGELQDRVFLHQRRELMLPAGVPVLLLDADLDPLITKKLFPELRTVTVRARLNAEVVQITDTVCSKKKLLGYHGREPPAVPTPDMETAARRRADILALARQEAFQGRKVLLVTYKPVAELLRQELGQHPGLGTIEVAHFGAVRGLDGWRDFDTVIVAGREEMQARVAEALARAWFGDDAEPLLLTGEYVKQPRRYRTRDGSAQAAEVYVHPDLRAQALLEQAREREIEQSVGRLRAVRRTRPGPARVLLLSNLPTDLTVDRFTTWRELMPDPMARAIVLGGGVLPLSAAELARLPGSPWADATAVRNWRAEQRRKGTETPIRDLYWEISTLSEITVVSYRRQGASGRGSPHQAILPGRVEDVALAAARLQAALGPAVEQVRLVEILHRPGALALPQAGAPLVRAPPPPAAAWREDRPFAAALPVVASTCAAGLRDPPLRPSG